MVDEYVNGHALASTVDRDSLGNCVTEETIIIAVAGRARGPRRGAR